MINTSTSVIGRYERDEMAPSIEAVRKIAKILSSTVGYLLDEPEQENLFKAPSIHKRLNEIEKMERKNKNHILYAIDAFTKSVKLKNITALKIKKLGKSGL